LLQVFVWCACQGKCVKELLMELGRARLLGLCILIFNSGFLN
jgi:ABC-type cobalamin transport system permease subunit